MVLRIVLTPSRLLAAPPRPNLLAATQAQTNKPLLAFLAPIIAPTLMHRPRPSTSMKRSLATLPWRSVVLVSYPQRQPQMLNTYSETLTEYWRTYSNAAFSDWNEEFDDAFTQSEENYLAAKSNIRTLIEERTHPAAANNPVAAAEQAPPKSDIKLPRIQIPKFSGSFHTWPSFYDLYTSLEHNATSKRCTICDRVWRVPLNDLFGRTKSLEQTTLRRGTSSWPATTTDASSSAQTWNSCTRPARPTMVHPLAFSSSSTHSPRPCEHSAHWINPSNIGMPFWSISSAKPWTQTPVRLGR